MASTYITPEQVAKTALALLRQDLVLGGIVNRESEDDFAGKVGSTVHVRVPAVLQARTRALNATTAITVDDVTERDQPIVLDEHAYSAVRISDEDYSLNIQDFARQVLAPQVSAVAGHVEAKVANTLSAVAETTSIAYDGANPIAALLAARKMLREMGVPAAAGWYAVVGTSIATDLLSDSKLTDASASGDTSALREAIIGKVAGFEVVEHTLVSPTDIVCFHRDAFTLATVAPRTPEGVSFGKSIAEEGYAMRAIRDYDSNLLEDRSVVSTFVGARSNALTKPDGTTAVPAIRIDTTTAPV